MLANRKSIRLLVEISLTPLLFGNDGNQESYIGLKKHLTSHFLDIFRGSGRLTCLRWVRLSLVEYRACLSSSSFFLFFDRGAAFSPVL